MTLNLGGGGGGATTIDGITGLEAELARNTRLSNWFKGGITGKKIALVGDSTSELSNAVLLDAEMTRLVRAGDILGGCSYRGFGNSGLTMSGFNGTTTGGTAGVCSMTSGSAVLTATTSLFAPGDVGKNISVTSAATGPAVLSTTILSYTSPTQVTLSANCTNSVSGVAFSFWTGSVAGTGLGDGKCGTSGTNGSRYIDVVAYAPDVIVLSFGINDVRDGSTTANQLQTYIQRCLDNFQTDLPNCDIVLRMPNPLAVEDTGSHWVTGITPQAATTILYNAYKYFENTNNRILLMNTMDTLFGGSNAFTLARFSSSRVVTDAAISASSFTLTSATASFTSADVGKYVLLSGAGAGGQSMFVGISGYTNSTTVTLAFAASQTVSGARCEIGTRLPGSSLMVDQLHMNYGYTSLGRAIGWILSQPVMLSYAPSIGTPRMAYDSERANHALQRSVNQPWALYPRVLEHVEHYQLVGYARLGGAPGATSLTLTALATGAPMPTLQQGDLCLFYDDETAWDSTAAGFGGSVSTGNTTVATYASGRGPNRKSAVTDADITASSQLLTSATAAFTSNDVGASITVNGAGVSGTNLITRIIGYVSATQVQLADAAQTTVTGATMQRGTASTAGLVGVFRPITYNDPVLTAYLANRRTYRNIARLLLGSGNDSGQLTISRLDNIDAAQRMVKTGDILYIPLAAFDLTVSSISVGATTTITFSAAHGMTTGEAILFKDVVGVNINGTVYQVTVSSSTVITIPYNSTGQTYVSGGTAARRSIILNTTNITISSTTLFAFQSGAKFASISGLHGYLISTRFPDSLRPQEVISLRSTPGAVISVSATPLDMQILGRTGYYAGFQAYLGTAGSGGATTFQLKRDGTLVATLSFASGANTATITWASGSSFYARYGSRMTIECATVNGSPADLMVAFDSD